MLAPVRILPPAALVSLEEAKRHMVVDHDEDNDLITSLVAAATAYFDGWSGVLGRALVTQTWRQDFCGFSSRMRLPLQPAASISSLTYFDGSNIVQTLPDTVYVLLTDAIGPFVSLKPNQTWPSAYRREEAISITFVAGSVAGDVPAPIKTAILMLSALWYENREAATDIPLDALPFGIKMMVAPYNRAGI
jgi:uncharacterized phiE125 gp8 family phage protein